MSLMKNGILKGLTKDSLEKLKKERMILSDSDSLIISLLIEQIEMMNDGLHTIQIIASTLEDDKRTNTIFNIADNAQLN